MMNSKIMKSSNNQVAVQQFTNEKSKHEPFIGEFDQKRWKG